MKVASTVRGGGHATPFGPTVPTLPFQWLIRQVEERMIVLSDTGFHAAAGDPTNLKLGDENENYTGVVSSGYRASTYAEG